MPSLFRSSAPLLGNSPGDALSSTLAALGLGTAGGYGALTFDLPLALALAVAAVLAVAALALRLLQYRRRGDGFARAAAAPQLGRRLGVLLAVHVAGALGLTLLLWTLLGPAA